MLFSRTKYPQPFIDFAVEAPEGAHFMLFDQHYKSDKESYLVFKGYLDEEGVRIGETTWGKSEAAPLKSIEKFGRYGASGHKIRIAEALNHA